MPRLLRSECDLSPGLAPLVRGFADLDVRPALKR